MGIDSHRYKQQKITAEKIVRNTSMQTITTAATSQLVLLLAGLLRCLPPPQQPSKVAKLGQVCNGKCSVIFIATTATATTTTSAANSKPS